MTAVIDAEARPSHEEDPNGDVLGPIESSIVSSMDVGSLADMILGRAHAALGQGEVHLREPLVIPQPNGRLGPLAAHNHRDPGRGHDAKQVEDGGKSDSLDEAEKSHVDAVCSVIDVDGFEDVTEAQDHDADVRQLHDIELGRLTRLRFLLRFSDFLQVRDAGDGGGKEQEAVNGAFDVVAGAVDVSICHRAVSWDILLRINESLVDVRVTAASVRRDGVRILAKHRLGKVHV
mmetsp:Transcript_16236/g.32407  ORF Transcript_16236/g.32407 Transcript_16236/m.32407 type:complete len:233 (+) Transcript_16236:419-1117(+)